MRVIFIVRTTGEPDEELENQFIESIRDSERFNVLTVGREYYHNTVMCAGHPDASDECWLNGRNLMNVNQVKESDSIG